MRYSKKKVEGFIERKEVLSNVFKSTDEIIEYALLKYRRKDLAKDDVLDALAAALTAKIGSRYGFVYVPEEPETDSRGLKIQMIYCECDFSSIDSVTFTQYQKSSFPQSKALLSADISNWSLNFPLFS